MTENASPAATVTYVYQGDQRVGVVFTYHRVSDRAYSGYTVRWAAKSEARPGVTSLDQPTRHGAMASLNMDGHR